MEVLDRVAVLDEGEVIAFVRFHLLISKGAIGLSRLPSPAARVLQAAEFLRAPGECLKNPHAVERRAGLGEPGIVSERLGEIAERLGRDRLGEVGHPARRPVGAYQGALSSLAAS